MSIENEFLDAIRRGLEEAPQRPERPTYYVARWQWVLLMADLAEMGLPQTSEALDQRAAQSIGPCHIEVYA